MSNTRTNLDNIQGKRVLIVGLGKSGTAACQTMLDLGAEVSVQDRRSEREFDPSFINYLKGREVKCYFDDTPSDMGEFDMVVMSPGASTELPFVAEARDKGAEIVGELEIAYRISKGRFVAITGTNGKTTTTTLVGNIFEAAGLRTHVVGNIGTAAIADASRAKEDDWLITEASSFQLETTRYFKPTISALLNLAPDHLDRHHTMDEYVGAKAKVFANQTADGYLIVNADDPKCMALVKNAKATVVKFSDKQVLSAPAAYLKGDTFVLATAKGEESVCTLDDLKIIGEHNIENILAASAICHAAGIETAVISKAIKEFSGVEHRLEYCATVDGVKYYNDSKGTNIEAALTAIKALKENIILIAGGDGKGQDFDHLIDNFGGAVKYILLLGQDKKLIAKAAEAKGFTQYKLCKDMAECVAQAAKIGQTGDCVLLSPACASWDMYENYEQRGEHFKECVEQLSK